MSKYPESIWQNIPAGCNGDSEHKRLFDLSQPHGVQLLTALRSFRQQGLLFDFTINVQEQTFPCHRCVLAASSDFFRAMFEVDMCERGEGSVTLTNQSPAAVSTFLDFAYSGEALITDTNVVMIFQIASFLQVSVLSKACSDFLIWTMDLTNTLSVLSLAEAHGSASLLQSANDFVVENFYDLSQNKDFLDMQINVLEKCLGSHFLNVPSEENVVLSLLKWISHNPERQNQLPGLLSLTRLHHLPPPALKTLFDSDPLLSNDERCLALQSEAQHIQSQFNGLMTDARPSTTQSYIYIHKTEENGEIHHTLCYNLDSDEWKELRPEEGVRVPDPPGCCFTSFAEKIFITGGCYGNCCRAIRLHVAEPHHDATDEVWCFCPLTRTCTPAPALLTPRTMHTTVMCFNRIYVIGGRTKGSRDGALSLLEVEFYNPLCQIWTAVNPLPTAIFYPEATSCDSIIYILGSEVEITDSFNPLLDCFFRYDTKQDQWTRLVAEFGQFFHATLVKAVSINNTLHLCDLSTYKVFSFCPETCEWKGEGSFESAGFNAGAVGIRDRIYVLGGDYSPDEITDDVQVYHSDKSQWEEVTPMPRALTEFHCQLISFSKYRDPWRDETD